MRLCSLVFCLIMMALCNSHAEEVQWTHKAEQGEDASSATFYFFQSDGESIQRVRSLWNGGAQNAPEVIDYLFEGGKITIRTLAGKRSDLKALTAGKDASMTVKSEYSIAAGDTSKMLVQPNGKALTAEQRIDLYNLISALAMERRPVAVKK